MGPAYQFDDSHAKLNRFAGQMEHEMIEAGSEQNISQTLQERRTDILRIAERYGAYNVRIFGSVVRGEATADSDVDFLVDMDSDRSLFDLGGLLLDLQNLLGREVDVVTEKALHWYIRDRVLAEAKPL